MIERILPNGRVLRVNRWDDGWWECWLDEERDEAAIVGSALNSTIADLVGHDVAHEEWPRWIDDLAEAIEHEEAGSGA